MYQEPELNVEEKSNASVNKRLYKLLIIILRYTPVVLSINDILHSILSYYNINCYILSCLGKVTNVSIPVPKYGNPGMYNQEMIVDITAEINGTSASFQKLPAMGDIADFGNNIVVSCNKEAMNSEVSSMKQRSLDIINSIETHQSIIKGCDEILSQLNPEIVEKQRQEQENKALREEINSLKEMFREFIKTSLKQEQHGNNN